VVIQAVSVDHMLLVVVAPVAQEDQAIVVADMAELATLGQLQV
jgi:hypothetical protein